MAYIVGESNQSPRRVYGRVRSVQECPPEHPGEADEEKPGLAGFVRWENLPMDQQTYPFRLSGLDGEVVVQYGPNADPARWGYDLLGRDFPSTVAKGFPVLRADVTYEGDGYAATLGWLQVVSMTVAAEREPRTMVDVPPQLIATGFPYISFGIEPTMFDAPSTTDSDVDWVARTFLTASPDRLMTRVVEPVFGLRWGYTLREGLPQLKDLARTGDEDWREARLVIARQFRDWEFRRSWAEP